MTTNLLTVFLFSYLFSILSERTPSLGRNVWGKQKANFVLMLVPLLIMLWYSAARNNIGDTFFYTHTYNLDKEAGVGMPTLQTKSYLFALLQYLMQQADMEPHALITICALFIIIPMILFLRNFSYSCDIAIFFCFTTGLYTATMNGIRQYVATGILLLGTKYLFSPKKTDFFKYLIFVLIAFLFHSSSLFMIPIYFVCRQRAWSLPTFAIIIGGLLTLFFVSMFMPSFMDILEGGDYEMYTQGWFEEGSKEVGTSIFRILFNSLPMVLSIYFSREIRSISPVCDVLINLSVVHASIYIIAGYNWIFARFAFFTAPYMILLLSLIFGVCLRQKRNQALQVLLIGAYLVFFIKEAYATGMDLYSSTFFKPNNNLWFEFLK